MLFGFWFPGGRVVIKKRADSMQCSALKPPSSSTKASKKNASKKFMFGKVTLKFAFKKVNNERLLKLGSISKYKLF